MAAHEHKHGVLPSEYDIREIDEVLYLKLLQKFKQIISKFNFLFDKTIIKKYFN